MSPFEIAVVAIAAVPSYLLMAVLVGRFFDWVWEGEHSDRAVVFGGLWPLFLPLALTILILGSLFTAVEWGMGKPNPAELSEKEETP